MQYTREGSPSGHEPGEKSPNPVEWSPNPVKEVFWKNVTGISNINNVWFVNLYLKGLSIYPGKFRKPLKSEACTNHNCYNWNIHFINIVGDNVVFSKCFILILFFIFLWRKKCAIDLKCPKDDLKLRFHFEVS